ncbi:glycosyltransferase family 39 protein, partial [bacterium]|nr:glycosyltransferase family 39 protein [bacterium]
MIKKVKNFIERVIFSNSFDISLIVVGICFRIRLYLENHSVWLDEAVTTVSIGSRSFSEIWRHFDIFPTFAKPPLGFQLIEKLSITAFGNNEYAFRLFPLLASVFSVILFYVILKKLFDRQIRTVALILFVVCDPLIHYCADTKPYSSDVLMALILVLLFGKMKTANLNFKNVLTFGFVGGLIIWISNACIFVLAGVAIAITAVTTIQKKWKKFAALFQIFFIWLLSFVLLYKVSLTHMVHGESLKNTWVGAFGPTQIFSFETLTWIKDVFIQMFKHPVGLYFPLIPLHVGVLVLLIFFAGCWFLLKKNREYFFIFFCPIILALFAALVGKYPFRGRVILFLVPMVIIFLAAGTKYLSKSCKKFSSIVALLMAFILLYYPGTLAVNRFFHGRGAEENREAFQFLQDNYLSGDMIFFNTSGQFSFWYYAKNLGFYSDLKKRFFGILDGELVEGVLTGQFAHKIGEFKGRKYAALKYDYNIFDNNGFFRRIVPAHSKDKVKIVFEKLPLKYDGPDRAWVFISRCEKNLKEIILGAFDKRG